MSSGAAQLPSHRGGRCRHRGAVMGCRAPHTRQPERGWAAQPAVAVVAVQGCPDAGHAVRRSVRVRCPPCGRTSVQLVGWTSGVRASGVHASGVHAPGVHTTGVIRVSGRTRVRCPRPLQPRWIRNTSVRRDRPRLVHRVRRVAVVGERLGRRCPNRAWRAKDGRTLAVRGSHEGRRQTWRCFAGVQAAAPRSPPGRPGELVQGQVPVGWWGAGEEQVLPSPRRCVLGGLPACWPTMGWTGRW